VDSFHGHDKALLLKNFRDDTYDAINYKISLNPILNSFQHTVHKYKIEQYLIETFLNSMEKDLVQNLHDEISFKEYILGSAEVVGLMCLKVFTEGDEREYEMLKPYAMKLGAAFQKINFLRDLESDFNILGRMYFPYVNFGNFRLNEKKKIEEEIESDFSEALEGIRMLPSSSRAGVYLAYYYYYRLFDKIKKTEPEKILTSRIRIPLISKVYLMFESMVKLRLNIY